MAMIRVSEEGRKQLFNAKLVLELSSMDAVIQQVCSDATLSFIKTYGGSNQEDFRNYVTGLHKATEKYIQKQVGRPMARFADFEKMYWHRLVHLDDDFKNLNFKLDTLLRVAKKEIGIQPDDEVEDFQNSIEQKNKDDIREEKELEKQRRMLQLSESTNTELQNKIIELYSQFNLMNSKFKKKDSMFGGKTQYELILNQEEFENFRSVIEV